MIAMTELRQRIEKRVAYHRTKRELRNMPLDVALDLGMFREDASKNASKAVYG